MELKDYTLELFPDTKQVEISGSISGMFLGRDVLYSEEAKESTINNLIGTPIKNNKTNEVVGKITKIDIENDIWYGEIYVQNSV